MIINVEGFRLSHSPDESTWERDYPDAGNVRLVERWQWCDDNDPLKVYKGPTIASSWTSGTEALYADHQDYLEWLPER